MVVSVDDMQVAIVEESTPGVTPATPAFKVMRWTSEDITLEFNNEESQEVGGAGRGDRDDINVGATVPGSISFELHKSDAMDMLLAAFCGSDWGADPLDLGAGTPDADLVYTSTAKRTFTIEKRFKINDTPSYIYHRYTGCLIDGMSLAAQPNQRITGSFTVIGMTRARATTAIAGATYAAAGENPVFTAPEVSQLELQDLAGTPLAWSQTAIWQNLSLEFSNRARGIAGIGFLGNLATNLGKQQINVTASILFEGDDVLDVLEARTKVKLAYTLADSAGNSYTFLLPRTSFSGVTVVAGGTGQDVVAEGTIRGLVGASPDIYPLSISRVAA